MALVMRTQLARPGQDPWPDTYNELFTMHGSIMLSLFVVPFALGLANYIVPLQIGAPGRGLPRLNALSYWLFLFGGLAMISGSSPPGGRRSAGSPTPRSRATTPGVGSTFGSSASSSRARPSVLAAVNLMTTIFMLRAPGMTMFRMPIFTWNILVTRC